MRNGWGNICNDESNFNFSKFSTFKISVIYKIFLKICLFLSNSFFKLDILLMKI